MSKYRSFHLPGSYRHFLPSKEYRTLHIKIQLRVDPEAKTIEGECVLKVETLRDGLSSLTFDACEMKVARVSLDGDETRFEYDGQKLRVLAKAPLKAATHEVAVSYSSTPTRGVYFVHPDAADPKKPVQVWTQCETEAARYWLPCQDQPDDKSTTETIITAPEPYDVISTGRLVSRTSSGGWSTHRWSEEAPHSTYLNSFVIGKFVKTEAEAEGVPLQYYSPQEKSADVLRYFGQTPEMMRCFVRLTGYKYPFEKYAQVAVHDFIYGGMENISATTLVDTRFPDARSEEDYAARYSRPDRNHIELVSHELAHMWFGDLVTAKDWSHAWLNEGFATYMEALYCEAQSGKDEFRQNMQFKASAYFEEDLTRYRRPIVDSDYLYADDVFDTCTYEKGAWMLHQLRFILGDDLFFRGVREYIRRFAYKNADTHDLMRTVEESTGISLESYFEQAFFRGGYPDLEVEYRWDDASKLAELEIRQKQEVDELTPAFQLPCDIAFYTEKGRQVRRVWLRSQQEWFGFQLDSEPRIVEVDPEGWLLKKISFNKSRSLLLNQLRSSEDALSRKQAAEGLPVFKGDDEVLEALRSAVMTEQHWSVRAEAVRSIGKIGGRRSLEMLLELRNVKNRRVRRAVVAALGEFKDDPRSLDAIKDALFHDESPYVQCEAALSLGRLGAEGAFPLLKQAMEIPSPEHGLTEASLEALGSLKKREEEVREVIRANLAYGKPTRVRVGALKGFIKLGNLQEKDVEPLKEIALRDSDYIVRSQALITIGELADKRFIETLKVVATSDNDNRNRRKASEVLLELESSSPDEGRLKSLGEEVAKLKAENAEIRNELAKLRVSGQTQQNG